MQGGGPGDLDELEKLCYTSFKLVKKYNILFSVCDETKRKIEERLLMFCEGGSVHGYLYSMWC